MTPHETGSTATPGAPRATAPLTRTFGPQGPTLGDLIDAYLQDYQVRQFRSQSTARGRSAHLAAFFGRDARAATLTTYNRGQCPDVTPRTMTRIEEPPIVDDNLEAELERLRAENARLKHDRGRTVSLKVSAKGGVSVYGLGRFPVTLYKEQWITLLAMTDDIRAFLTEHDAELKTKSEA